MDTLVRARAEHLAYGGFMDMQHRFTPTDGPTGDQRDDERPFPRRAEYTRSLIAIADGRAFASGRPLSSLSADQWPDRKAARTAMMMQRRADRRFARWEEQDGRTSGWETDQAQPSTASRVFIALAGLLTGIALAQALETGLAVVGGLLGL